ncbi:HNH endonuclease [Actinosynnema sp. CA-299493]
MRDELILACDLVMRNNWRVIPAEDRQVVELSELLRSLPIHSNASRGPDFRNAHGVERKTADIATLHPDYRGKKTNGGRLTEEVFMEFLEQPERMAAAAESLRIGVASGEFNDLPTGPYEDDGYALEGRLLERRYFARERDPKLRERKVKSVLAEQGRLECEVCGFDFERTYGERGKGYVECHHATPLHVSGPTNTRLKDLVILCANCHRMIHRGKLWLSPDELRELVQACKLGGTADGTR